MKYENWQQFQMIIETLTFSDTLTGYIIDHNIIKLTNKYIFKCIAIFVSIYLLYREKGTTVLISLLCFQ